MKFGRRQAGSELYQCSPAPVCVCVRVCVCSAVVVCVRHRSLAVGLAQVIRAECVPKPSLSRRFTSLVAFSASESLLERALVYLAVLSLL